MLLNMQKTSMKQIELYIKYQNKYVDFYYDDTFLISNRCLKSLTKLLLSNC